MPGWDREGLWLARSDVQPGYLSLLWFVPFSGHPLQEQDEYVWAEGR